MAKENALGVSLFAFEHDHSELLLLSTFAVLASVPLDNLLALTDSVAPPKFKGFLIKARIKLPVPASSRTLHWTSELPAATTTAPCRDSAVCYLVTRNLRKIYIFAADISEPSWVLIDFDTITENWEEGGAITLKPCPACIARWKKMHQRLRRLAWEGFPWAFSTTLDSWGKN
jgi:hypothetical protein